MIVCLMTAISILAQNKDFCLADNGKAATIAVDTNDWKGVLRAANDLREDVNRVTGVTPTLQTTSKLPQGEGRHVIIGTIGKSKLIDLLIKQKKLNVDGVRGEWESYIIETLADGNLVVAGSDKRGTIYGIYEISERIGVSPWYWWADAPVAHKDKLYWQSRSHCATITKGKVSWNLHKDEVKSRQSCKNQSKTK